MEFLDTNHRIFSLPSFKEKPIGYQNNNQSYIFWVDSNNQSYLSVDNYYIQTIYCLLNLNEYGLDIFLKQVKNINKTDIEKIEYWLTGESHVFTDEEAYQYNLTLKGAVKINTRIYWTEEEAELYNEKVRQMRGDIDSPSHGSYSSPSSPSSPEYYDSPSTFDESEDQSSPENQSNQIDLSEINSHIVKYKISSIQEANEYNAKHIPQKHLLYQNPLKLLLLKLLKLL